QGAIRVVNTRASPTRDRSVRSLIAASANVSTSSRAPSRIHASRSGFAIAYAPPSRGVIDALPGGRSNVRAVRSSAIRAATDDPLLRGHAPHRSVDPRDDRLARDLAVAGEPEDRERVPDQARDHEVPGSDGEADWPGR